MNRQQRRAQAKYVRSFPKQLTELPRYEWPTAGSCEHIAVWRSRDYLVQVFKEQDGIVRLSVNRSTMGNNGRWHEDIPWTVLQDIKNAIGYRDQDAVEVFPALGDEVNVANMRHLWVMPERLTFAWRARAGSSQ